MGKALVPEIPVASGYDPAAMSLTTALQYPQWRFMGSKHRLLPWLHDVFSGLHFDSALDAFSGSGCVGYLLKAMGKSVTTNDHLNFTFHIAQALIANPGIRLDEADIRLLLQPAVSGQTFIDDTFRDIFYETDDRQFLDRVWSNLGGLQDPYKQSLAIAAMCRAAIKKQPRGVFTISGRDGRYHDGRRDLAIPMEAQFQAALELFDGLVYDSGRQHKALRGDVFATPVGYDLVYMDPPYVPRSDDNCYIKRYHFLEGLSCYWEGQEILWTSRVRKIKKRYTPFSYRKSAIEAFDRLFERFSASTIVLSYSSTGYPDRETLVAMLGKYKSRVTVHELDHRYHFGNHAGVGADRAVVKEYLFVAE